MDISDIGKQAAQDLLANLTQAKAFVLEQAPDVLQQMVSLEIHQCAFVMAGSAIIFLAMWAVAYKVDDWKENSFIVFLFSLLPFANFIYEAYNLMSVMTAPKVFLIHELSKMVR